MSLPKEEKQIVLTLTNSSTLSDATVDLFSFPSTFQSGGGGSGGATASGQEIGINNSDFAGTAWRFFYDGGSTFFSVGVPTDIDDLLRIINDEFGDIFWKETDPTFNWSLRCASSDFIFTTTTISFAPTKTWTDFASNFISGTTVRATMGYSNVTYNSITSELSSQPYLITTIYISSTTLTQVEYPFSINLLDQNGVASTKPIQPLIDPNQVQNVNVAIPMFMTTGALNAIQYTIEPSGSVLMVVRYEHIDLVDAGRLMDSDKFQKEMALLKEQDEEQYQRIMDMISEFPNGSIQWQTAESEKKQEPVVNTFAVPLFYVVAVNNGNKNVRML